MPRVALLVGVSQYSTGLDPLPDAQKDVEVMQRVLQQPRFQFELVQALCDRPLQVMEETIELFFKQRGSDDQIVFLFCGYVLQDADSRLYLATPITQLDDAGAFVKAQTIPTSVVQEAMNSSPAKQQVLILDLYQQPVLKHPASTEPASISTQLGGAGRVILAAHDNRSYPTPTAIDAWTYTRYLVEGIESGSADMDDDGSLTAADLHHYAAQKLQVAAPGLAPQQYGSAETAQMPLFEVSHDDPHVRYRKVLEAAAIADTVDAANLPLLEGRSLLNDVRHSFGVSLHEAAILETQVLRPTREYHQRVKFYQQQVNDYARSHDVNSPPIRQALKQLQQALCLTDSDIAITTVVPVLALNQRQKARYQENLAQYQQVLLGAMQRQPLREGDRAMLHRLQQTLGLEDDDVKAAETEITTQAEQFLTADGNSSTAVAVEPPASTASETSTERSPEPPAPEPSSSPQPSEAPVKEVSNDSRAREVILQRLFTMNEPTNEPTQLPGSEPLPDAKVSPDPLPTLVREEAPPVPSNAQLNMDRMRRSTSNYQALIVPAVLLAAIVGLVAAVLPSANRPGWFNIGQTPADPAAAQRFKNDGLQKAREGKDKEAIDNYNQALKNNPTDASVYIDRGVAHHRLGDTGAAIKDYEQALKLNPSSALSYSNLSYAYYDRQNYDKALETGNQAVALDGNLAQAHINLANARAKKGDNDGALRDYTQAIRLRASNEVQAGAFNNRGNVQFALNKISEAINDYKQAIRSKSDYADAHYNLGLAQQAQGNRGAASSSLQTAASLYQKEGKDALQKEAIDRANALR